MNNKVDLVCFGELIWDILPTHKVAGGAPFNVVNRATALGLNAKVISSVGDDALGREIVALAQEKGNCTDYIQIHPTLPTSTVEISVGKDGEPTYDFLTPVAWDDIEISDDIKSLVAECGIFVYSSLGLRDERSREALFSILPGCNYTFCDINLREGMYTRNTIMRMLEYASILRMNEYELEQIAKWLELDSTVIEGQLAELAILYHCDTVIVTLGPKGAMSYRNGNYCKQPVFNVEVKDTVGSGDAFLAAYLTKRLANADEDESLRFACAVGAINASKDGGTPIITEEEINEMLTV